MRRETTMGHGQRFRGACGELCPVRRAVVGTGTHQEDRIGRLLGPFACQSNGRSLAKYRIDLSRLPVVQAIK